MKIKIFQDIKFLKEEFIQTKNNLEKGYENEKEKIKSLIDSKIQSMKKEYDNFIEDIKKGNIKLWRSFKGNDKKIENDKNNVEKQINIIIPIFRQNLLKKLDFIGEKLKLIIINKGNFSFFNLFKSIENAEDKTFGFLGMGSLGRLIFDIEGSVISGISTATNKGIGVVTSQATQIEKGIFSLSSLGGFCLGIGIAFGINYSIHGLFALYKKFVEKNKYIELVEEAKIELEKSVSDYREYVYEILKKITSEIELAVKKFFDVQNAKLDGIKNHLKDWLLLREQIISSIE